MFAKKIGLELKIIKKPLENHPPWLLLKESINTELARFKKDLTPNLVYLQHFHEILCPFINNNWTILFTDGSKCEDGTSFAIVNFNSNLISSEKLPSFFSIFFAEALAILKSTQIAIKSKKKTLIYTDSLSTLTAIENVNNRSAIIVKIRDNIIKLAERLKIFWVPAHIGVKGNEHADREAKTIARNSNHPISYYPPSKIDILKLTNSYLRNQKLLAWSQYNHFYSSINQNLSPATYPTSTPENMIRCFIRLRLGHTQLTHSYLLNKDPPPTCHLCQLNVQLTTNHITTECPKINETCHKLFNNNLKNLLIVTSNQNIKNVFKTLKIFNLHLSI